MLAADDGCTRMLQVYKRKGSRMRWTRIRMGVQGQGRHVCDFWIAFVVDHVKFVEVSSCCFDFRCASSYIMVGVVFLLVLGSIRD